MALEQLQLGSNKPYCWFTKTGPKLDVNPHLQQIIELAFVLQARVFLLPESPNINSNINDIVTLYKFGAHIASGPNLAVDKRVGIAIKGLSARAAFNFLDRKMLDAASMKSLEDRFKQLATDYNESIDIRGEKIIMREKVETDYTNLKMHLKSTLEYCDMVAARTPWKLRNDKATLSAKTNLWIENIAPAIAWSTAVEFLSRTEIQALITTLSIIRYHNDKNDYPETLSQLIMTGYLKKLPKDPFSNKPLVYKRTQQGFILYSLGGDFADDGGKYSKSGYSEQGGDHVFWPVEKRP